MTIGAPDEVKVMDLARELYGAFAKENQVEFWDNPDAFIDRSRFVNLARTAIDFLDTYEEDDFLRAFDIDEYFEEIGPGME